MTYILKEYLLKIESLKKISIGSNIGKRPQNGLSLVIPEERLNSFDFVNRNMLLNVPFNIDNECKIDELYRVLKGMSTDITKFEKEGQIYYISFILGETTPNAETNNSSQFNINYKIKIKRR